MKTIFAFALAALSLAGSAAAQQKSDVASKLLALEQKWTVAYQKGDIAALNTLLTDDFIITVEDGQTFSKSGYVVHAGDPNVQVEVAEVNDVRTRIHGNTAVITGAYHEKGKNKGKPYELNDRFTDVWMNNNGQWQLIASHYSVPQKS